MATEAEILKALRAWHKISGSLFFQHVKTGASFSRDQLRILDGLHVKIAWTKPIFEGYEVKISRSDFLRDTKYTESLPYCTHFSFVVPDKMVRKDELPDHIGLIYYKEDGSLRRVRKAQALPLQDPEKLNSMLRYLVYYRTPNKAEHIQAATEQARHNRRRWQQAEDNADRWRDKYYAASNKLYKLGYKEDI